MKDDIIYIVLLISCIGFGNFYRKCKDADHRKWIGTIFGLLIVLSVSGLHILHALFCYLVTGLIIVYYNRKQCHMVSFFFMFLYLFFFRTTNYFGIDLPPGHTNLVQMILTLKLVGLAGEVNSAYVKSQSNAAAKKDDNPTHSTEVPLTIVEQELLNIHLVDILHYAFNYVGVLTGPYFTYKTYRDFIHLPFSQRADCINATIAKFKWVPLYTGLFLLTSYVYPLDYATTSEFYDERSFFYRILYVWPTFFIFRMRIYTGIVLSECVCTMAGLGAYPVECENKSGGGPSREYLHLVEKCDKVEYDFNTIRNIDVPNTEKCITFREAMKYWNMCVQYWMAINVYKRFPSKTYRTVATLGVSAIWHGVYAGYYFCILAAPFYLPIEDMYTKLYRASAVGTKRTILDIVCWTSKFFAFSYMGIAFLLMTIDKIWFYYSSVYHFAYIAWITLYITGIFIIKGRKKKALLAESLKQSQDEKKTN